MRICPTKGASYHECSAFNSNLLRRCLI
ncbi:hypothetical protein V12B01_12860 [Vibrio splendidus 12B01]|nr:hypothetical protein V12B01_12860 [Vibrio splendidus 12B01]